MSFQNACGRLGRQTSARLKITFVDMTYPKGWTRSLPLCPLIFSWCDILPCVFSDHDFVILDYDIAALPLRGPGVWKFNNSLLDDESFCLEISDLIEQFLAFRHCFASQRDFWESLKSDIKLTAIAFSRRKHRLLSSQKVFF